MYNIPILFIFFRRKETALKSFERIRDIRPSTLYLACDGARSNIPGEREIVEETRKVILESIDWPCDIHTLFQDKNLGCGMGVYTAICWLFENEEKGIILEEDCIANNSFFPYVAELLERYKNDNRIGMIAGTNKIPTYPMSYSYCFSKYASIWGWATWRRAWQHMSLNLDFLTHHQNDVLKNRGYQGKETRQWKWQLNMINKNRVSAWDWQWCFSLASQNQLCIFPKVNLISNIGNDAMSTHTAYSNIFIPCCDLDFPLNHPLYVMPDNAFDRKLYHKGNSIFAIIKRHIPFSIKQFIKQHMN